MDKIKFDDNLPQYTEELYKHLETAYKNMADDTRRYAQMKVPKDTGELRATAEVEKLDAGIGIHYKVWFDRYDDLGYALNQERGYGPNGEIYRHYTKAGTGPHYLENAIDRISSVYTKYIKIAVGRIKKVR